MILCRYSTTGNLAITFERLSSYSPIVELYKMAQKQTVHCWEMNNARNVMQMNEQRISIW